VIPERCDEVASISLRTVTIGGVCRPSQAEVRCHAVLCKTELIAQTIAAQLQERLAAALSEFRREKRRSQHSRLTIKLHHQSSLPNDVLNHQSGGASVRTKFLKLGQNFRPPIGHSNSAPRLGSITEGDEDEIQAAADVSLFYNKYSRLNNTFLTPDVRFLGSGDGQISYHSFICQIQKSHE